MSDLAPEDLRAKAFELLCALDDIELSVPARLIAGRLVRLSYGRGRVSVLVPFQQRLGELCGVGKTHIRDALKELIDRARILQIYPDGERYEILPDAAAWRPRPRCQFGPAHAAAIESEIDARNEGEQRDLGELEMTFQPDPIATAMGEVARDSAFSNTVISCPPEPGDAGGPPVQSPPGFIGQPGGPGVRLTEMLRQALAAGAAEKKVTDLVTSSPSSTRAGNQKVTRKVTFQKPPHPVAAEKLPNRELLPVPRARASDHLTHLDHLDHPSSQLSSSSSGSSGGEDDDQAADEADDSVAAGKVRKVPRTDVLLDDIRRALGPTLFAGWEDWWREAIAHCRPAAARALEALKRHEGPRKPGHYIGGSFRQECRRAGRPFREIAVNPLPQEEQAQ